MLIEVTREHISQGQRQECALCPVALAIKAVIPCTYCAVGVGSVQMIRRKQWYDLDLPAKVQKFIKEFDLGLPVRPFSFELELL